MVNVNLYVEVYCYSTLRFDFADSQNLNLKSINSPSNAFNNPVKCHRFVLTVYNKGHIHNKYTDNGILNNLDITDLFLLLKAVKLYNSNK